MLYELYMFYNIIEWVYEHPLITYFSIIKLMIHKYPIFQHLRW